MEPGNINRLLLIEKVLVLKSLNLFKDTPENVLADLAPLMKEMQYEQGTEILKKEKQVIVCILFNKEISKFTRETQPLQYLKKKKFLANFLCLMLIQDR